MSQPAGKAIADTTLIEHLPYDLDDGISRRALIGLIVLATDYTIEYEWRQVFTQLDGVALYQSRIPNDDLITPESLRAMESRIVECASVVTPDTPLDVIAYGCTSASIAIGETAVFANLKRAKPEAKYSTPITAAFAAFDAFKAQRIGVLTPYSAEVNKIVSDYIRARGYQVPVFGSFNLDRDTLVARITPQSIEAGVRELIKHAEIDAIFVSCTSVRLMAVCADLERNLGIPLTSSNHAMAWHTLRLAGIEDKLGQFGALYDLQLCRDAT